MRLFPALVPVVSLLLTGCALQSTAPLEPQAGPALQGKVHGGQQPIVGAHIYLYAANTTGYGGDGIAASASNASISLLNSSVLTNNPGSSGQDSGGYYVTTAADGSFSITGDYACTSGQQLYLYALGGNPGAGVNSAAGLLAAIGDCSTLSASSFFWMNEVSTIAAAYSLAAFATDATHISSPNTTQARTGIANAFLNSQALAAPATGMPASLSGITAPVNEINSLANVLASCVNSSGPSSSACGTLLTTATSTGATGGAQPTDTATAAINIAHHPAANVTALYGIPAPANPFSPALTLQPSTWSIAVTLTGGNLNDPEEIAIDSAGNAWVSSAGNSTLVKFTPLGTVAATATGGGLSEPIGIALDTSGNVWTANNNNSSVSEFTSSGTAVSGSSGYTGGGNSRDTAIAIDPAGNVWASGGLNNTLTKLVPGTTVTATAYTGIGLNGPGDIDIDQSNNLWIPNSSGGTVSEINSAGIQVNSFGGGLDVPQHIALDASGNPWVNDFGNNAISKINRGANSINSYTGSLDGPGKLAIDSAGNVWVPNFYTSEVVEFNAAGVVISGGNGYIGTVSSPQSLALDSSGNVWVPNLQAGNITRFIGLAAPVVTPVVANLISPYGHPASKP